jgi:hypothetical protein
MLTLAFAGAAQAAPPWSPTQSLSTPSPFVDNLDVVFAADGRALATWREGGPPLAQPSGAWRLAVREPGALVFGPERNAPDFATQLSTYGLDRFVALDMRARSRGRVSLGARFGDSSGTFGPSRTISTYRPAGGPPSLANGSLVAWISRAARGRRIVRAALKSRGRFRHPFTLRGRGRANDVVAGTALGVNFVAWERAGVVEARVSLAGRRPWGPVQRLGRAEKAATTFAAIGSGRRGYLAWLAEGARSAFIRTAVLPVGSARFRKAEAITTCPASARCVEDTIDHEAPADGHALRLVPLADRDAVLAWSDWYIYPGVWQVRAAVTTGRGAHFSDPFGVSPLDQSSVLGDVAVAPPEATGAAPGTMMFVWSRLDAVGELGDRVQARTLLPGHEPGPVEDVSELDRARLPAVAFDFSAQRWTAVWSQRLGPETPAVPLAQVTTFARFAARPG